MGSVDAAGPSPSMESLRLSQSAMSDSQVGVYETFRSVEQVSEISTHLSSVQISLYLRVLVRFMTSVRRDSVCPKCNYFGFRV
jgi:hypothetical protein